MYKVGRSRTPQGVRGLKHPDIMFVDAVYLRRTPQGVRGLKHRGANTVNSRKSRTPQGVRGLKQEAAAEIEPAAGRTPQGVRGLKRVPGRADGSPHPSHSARSAWIETRWSACSLKKYPVALRKECVD